MSDKAEELAGLILEKSEAGYLHWELIPSPDEEVFRADIGEGRHVRIRRSSRGDDKVITLKLLQGPSAVLTGIAHNFVSTLPQASFPILGLLASKHDFLNALGSLSPDLARFRLFSDLFHSAKPHATGEDSALAECQGVLEQLGKDHQ